MFKQRLKLTSLTIKNRIKEHLLYKRRSLAVSVFSLLLCCLLIARLFYLQIAQHHYYTTLSTQNEISLLPLPPKRGLIYDRNGLLLAKNIPVFSLMVTPDKTVHFKAELRAMQTIIPLTTVDLQEYHRQLSMYRRFEEVPLKLKLTPQQVAAFAVNSYQFPGFSVKAELIRQYPHGKEFAHVIGYVGRITQQDLVTLDSSNYADTNYIGKTGIEAYYEPTLHGTVGYQRVETDASGRVVRVLNAIPPLSGSNLYLTIDSKLQQVAEKTMHGYNGTIVVIQPRTGEILAMTSEPSFNPNQFVKGISSQAYQTLITNPAHPLYNRAIHGLYSMGSTIKLFIGLEGLITHTITPDTRVYDPGWFKLPGNQHVFHDWLHTGHGWVNLHKAIAVSCDTYFYNLGYHLGIAPIDTILTAFGFGQATGIDLPNELIGTVPSPEYKMKMRGQPWYTGDTVNTAIGQGYSQATVLQLAVATSILATHGRHVKPTLLYAIQPPGKTEIYLLPQLLPRITIQDNQYWYDIISAMQDVIPHGTGFGFGHTPYPVAAKTGTAQVHSDEGASASNLPKNELSNSLFIAFSPIKNPQIAIAVVIEHDPDSAQRVARQVMDYYMLTEHHWQTPPPMNTTAPSLNS